MSFAIYMTGFLFVMVGLIYGAISLHIAPHWIVIGSLVLLGLGILSAVKVTRERDTP